MNSSLSMTGTGFVILTVIMYGLVHRELRRSIRQVAWTEERKKTISNRFLIGVTGWMAFLLIVSATGFFSDFSVFPPRIIMVLAVPLIAIILLVFSKPVKELLPNIPAQSIVRLQVFRVFVELLIWAAFVQNALPIQMTFEGRNFDVLSGLFAPLVAWLLVSNRTVLYIYNFVSLGLLLNIVAIAILSMPTPFRLFMNDPANVLVAQFPFVLLPGMLVPLAYGLSFLSLRQLSLTGKL